MKTQQKITLGILALLVANILVIPAVLASGVGSPYWAENPLRMLPGETKDIQFTLQNMVGDEDLKMKAEILNGQDIAKIIDASPIYDLPAHRNDVKVNVRVTIPKETPLGTKQGIKISFASVSIGNKGEFNFGSSFEKEFAVIIGDETKNTTGNNYLVVGIVAVLALAIVGYLLLRKKKE